MSFKPGQNWPDAVTVVAVEGIDGSGKSALVDSLIADPQLEAAFTKVSGADEFSSPVGHCLQEGISMLSPISIAYTFAAERHWLIEHCPSMPGGLLIWDRYVDSAYACRSADVKAGRAPSYLMDVVHEIVERMPKPTLTLYIDISVSTAFARTTLRQGLLGLPVRNNVEVLAFQRDAYEQLWRRRTPAPVRLDGEASRDHLLGQAIDAILGIS